MLLLLAAVPLETTLIRTNLGPRLGLITNATLTANIARPIPPLMLAHSGIGQINMAMQLTRILTAYHPQAVFLFGCGGAYPQSELQVGDVALATREIIGDTGVAEETEFIPFEQLKIPQQPELAPQFKQSYSLNHELLARAAQILPDIPQGPFVTVSTCSGHAALSDQIYQRTRGLCENMEGAAAARVCEQFNIPLLEMRGISNPTGTRDPQQWDIRTGTEAAQHALTTLLDNWS